MLETSLVICGVWFFLGRPLCLRVGAGVGVTWGRAPERFVLSDDLVFRMTVDVCGVDCARVLLFWTPRPLFDLVVGGDLLGSFGLLGMMTNGSGWDQSE